MLVCDGCGAPAGDAHIRDRIERLELATRFRPIHIQLLLIDAAPPARPEDYFYRAAKDRPVRSVAARMYFDELAKCTGVAPGAELQEESVLAEFQRRGFFLAHAVECPIEHDTELANAVRRLAPTVLKRVQTSYKPKYIALLSNASRELVPLLQSSGWGDRLILDNGVPFADPFLGDPQAQVEFATALGDRLSSALSRLA